MIISTMSEIALLTLPVILFECVGLAQCGGATLSQSDTLKFFGRDPRVASLLKAFSLQTAMHFSAVMRPG